MYHSHISPVTIALCQNSNVFILSQAVGGRKYLNDVDKKQELSMHEGKKTDNKAKNRYSDILPCKILFIVHYFGSLSSLIHDH